MTLAKYTGSALPTSGAWSPLPFGFADERETTREEWLAFREEARRAQEGYERRESMYDDE